jgi:hypothetical protein
MELSKNVETKLAEAIQEWADENLVGKPAILANCMFINLKKEMIKQATNIIETFK